MDSRLKEIHDIYRDYRDFYQITGSALLVGIGILVGALLFGGDNGYPTNLYTELLSISVTVLILDTRAQRREEKRQFRELQERLVREAASYSNEMAKRSLYELQYRGWLHGTAGLLKGANLLGANLEAANLESANLEGANLSTANLAEAKLFDTSLVRADLFRARLEKAMLSYANLAQADLEHASLEGANLSYTDLQNTRLIFANLKNVNLRGANLCGANLKGAALEGATLGDARLDSRTILPDGCAWTPETDLSVFGVRLHSN